MLDYKSTGRRVRERPRICRKEDFEAGTGINCIFRKCNAFYTGVNLVFHIEGGIYTLRVSENKVPRRVI
jgi:hypothetical protein